MPITLTPPTETTRKNFEAMPDRELNRYCNHMHDAKGVGAEYYQMAKEVLTTRNAQYQLFLNNQNKAS